MTMTMFNPLGEAVPNVSQAKMLGFGILGNIAGRFVSKTMTGFAAKASPESFTGKTLGKTLTTTKEGKSISVGDIVVAFVTVVASKVATDYAASSIGFENATAAFVGGSIAAVQPIVAPIVNPMLFAMPVAPAAPAAMAPAAQSAAFIQPRGKDRMGGNAFTARNLGAGYETTIKALANVSPQQAAAIRANS